MKVIRYVLFCVVCAATLAACGNKGPLVMPDQPTQSPQPAATPTTTPDSTQP